MHMWNTGKFYFFYFLGKHSSQKTEPNDQSKHGGVNNVSVSVVINVVGLIGDAHSVGLDPGPWKILEK